VDCGEPTLRVLVKALACALPNLLIGRVDVQHLMAAKVNQSEYFVYVLRDLSKSGFTFL
jgi:hypothetical protein